MLVEFHPNKFSSYKSLKLKPWRFASRIRDLEAFWYKTEIKTIYVVQLCLIGSIECDCMVYPDLKFVRFKPRNWTHLFFWGWRLILFWFYIITQGICNKFIKVNFCVGSMVWWPNHLSFVKYWWDNSGCIH